MDFTCPKRWFLLVRTPFLSLDFEGVQFLFHTSAANESNIPLRKRSQHKLKAEKKKVPGILMAEVKVFGAWGSPFTHRVEMALKLKGVEYEFIEEDVRNKSPQLLQYNPVHKKIPVLLHNGKPVAESLVILEYIDEAWEAGPSILPKHPYDRAMARFWSKFLDDKCVTTLWKACWIPGEEHEKDKEEAEESLKLLDNELKGKKFFGGDSFWAGRYCCEFYSPLVSDYH
ncbi:hypothetical protein F511_17776 [Dorcoceras hygrometricum]|uniref:Glutathione S-transferase n=1 Tax=Dorcoceras hygrometricum TaxID=472368 RepID=A0A2Z7AVA3_9LAMI|nr:hypothetical protein F511_17776 [Dorcoceras hygrometricum]